MTQQELELPKGWVEAEFKKTVKSIPLTGKKLKQKEYLQSGKFPVIDQGQDFIGGFTDKKDLVVECKLPIIVFGDHTKAVKFVNQNFVAGADGVKVLEPNPIFNPKLLYYFIHVLPLPNKGYARHYQHLEKLMIKIPPSNEQKRIVSKIEESFSKIDSVKQSLEYTKLQLGQYKYSLLKSAFEGKLTEKWREQNYDDSTENKKTEGLPNRWKFYKICEICKTTSGGTPPRKNPEYYIGNINWIKSGELNDSYILNSEEKISEDALKNSSAKMFPKNTVVLAMYGATIGKLGILRIEATTNQAICAFFIDENKIGNTFLFYYLMSIRGKLLNKGIGGAQDNLSQTIINDLSIPITSLEEQEQIVSQIEQGFSLIQNSQRIVNSTLQTLETMRMSVLKQAFEGKLVPQDPNDEPASILLEKIMNAQVDLKPKQWRAKNVK